MLQDILKIINRDRQISRTNIAKELDIPLEVVDDGLNQLLRMGYIIKQDTGQDCVVACGNCPYAKRCSKEIVKTFELSDKGNTLLNK